MAIGGPSKPTATNRGAALEAPAVASETLGTLLDVEAANLVVVHDTWGGEGVPLATSYELRRDEAGEFAGAARRFEHDTVERLDEIRMSATVARKFLRLLAGAVLAPGPYVPFMEHTDDFPNIEVAVHVGPAARRDGIALLFSSSQGQFYAPWCATVRGETFTLPGNDIGRALRLVRKLSPPPGQP